MDKINYFGNFAGLSQEGKYPVTIQGLQFVQNQILTLQNYVLAGGGRFILKEPKRMDSGAIEHGILVLDGEILPITNLRSYNRFIKVIETQSDAIDTDNGTYEGARTIREAKFVSTATDIAVSDLEEFKTNTELYSLLQKIEQKPIGNFLTMEIGIYRDEDLRSKKSPMRIFCEEGSVVLKGYKAYTIDVYDCGKGIVYQELKGVDMRRFGRYFHPETGKWSEFIPLDEQMNLEGKVVRGTFYLRHGFLPPYANIIVLRKKKCNTCAGLGRKKRSAKCAYYHGWKMTLTKGQPNQWYIPKCERNDIWDFPESVGQEFAVLMNKLLFKKRNKGTNAWRIAGVKKCWNDTTHAYAKLGLAVITAEKHQVVAGNMLRLKYRVASELNNGGWSNIRKNLSVD